jgi:hypothetical protein
MTRARDNADLGDSYGALGAGVTGGSGLTALGTVTSGNLSNTAIVHRSGASLQTKGDSYTPTGAITVTTSSGLLMGANLEVSITCASTSNFLHITNFIPDCMQNAGNHALHIGFKYSTASPFGTGTSLGRTFINSHFGYQTLSNATLIGASTELWVAVPTTSAMKIQVFTTALTNTGSNIKMFNNSGVSSFNVASLIVTEVKA